MLIEERYTSMFWGALVGFAIGAVAGVTLVQACKHLLQLLLELGFLRSIRCISIWW